MQYLHKEGGLEAAAGEALCMGADEVRNRPKLAIRMRPTLQGGGWGLPRTLHGRDPCSCQRNGARVWEGGGPLVHIHW